MAEGFAREMAAGNINVYSAGDDPQGPNDLAIDVMAELGIDIAQQAPTGFNKVPFNKIDTIITLCANADELPDKGKRKKVNQIHWPLTDPATITGSDAEVKKAYRAVRDEIRNRVQVLLVG